MGSAAGGAREKERENVEIGKGRKKQDNLRASGAVKLGRFLGPTAECGTLHRSLHVRQ